MRIVVADASALVEYVLRTVRASGIEETIVAQDVLLHVPSLCDVEFAAALRRGMMQGRLAERRGEEALTDYIDLPLIRHGHTHLLARVLQLRANFSPYDAVYVALAEELGASLLTADEPLARAVSKHTSVPLIGA